MNCEYQRFDVAAAPAGADGPPMVPPRPVKCDAPHDKVERIQVGTAIMWLCPEHRSVMDPPKEEG